AREFAESLLVADVSLLAPIYAAREDPMEGITARLIADAGKGIEFLEASNTEIVADLRQRLQPNDIFITMGAGDVHEIAEALVEGGDR
ncbi:MAG: UDP-N-acetylmuramate--L-alanine ligase, partial [Thermoanaerobaculia bacterium]